MEKFSAKHTFEEIRNFLAGRFMGATRDEFLLEEIVKLIFCKYELGSTNTTDIEEVELSKLYRETFKNVINEYSDIYSEQNCEIQLDPISIGYIDKKFNQIDLFGMKRDVIGDAYEIFIGDSIKGQSGQFFTPQNAAEALVKMIAPERESKVLDLTCGAGGFLVEIIRYWNETQKVDKKDNIYGIDKDNYLIRLAKIHLACMGQKTENIICADSLLWDEDILGKNEEAFDIILTNPPFGVNIQAGSLETLSKFEVAYKYKKIGNCETSL